MDAAYNIIELRTDASDLQMEYRDFFEFGISGAKVELLFFLLW